MSSAPFTVRTTSAVDRDLKKLAKRHRNLVDHYARAITILENDPYNRSRTHDIKKLEGVTTGEGQYRLRLGRFRLRYDIAGRVVTLCCV